MSTNDPQLEEILPLVDKMIDGVITPDELQQLEAALDCNPELQRAVFAYHQVHANLYSDIRSKQVLEAFMADELGMPTEAAAARMPALEAALMAGTGAAIDSDLKERSGSAAATRPPH